MKLLPLLVALVYLCTPVSIAFPQTISGERISVDVNNDGANDKSLNDAIDAGDLSGGGSKHSIEEDGTPLTARTSLNFVGGGVTCTDDAGNNETDCTVPVDGSLVYVDWDPAASGTDTAGLAEAVATCKGLDTNGGCVIRQRSNTSYSITRTTWTGAAQIGVDISDPGAGTTADNITIQCAPGSPITFNANSGNSYPVLIRVEDADNFKMLDCEINFTETCASTCGSSGNAVILCIGENTDGVEIRGNSITTTEPASTDFYKSYRAIWVTANNPGRIANVSITDNTIVTSSVGIEVKNTVPGTDGPIEPVHIQGNKISWRSYGRCAGGTDVDDLCRTDRDCASSTCSGVQGRPLDDGNADMILGRGISARAGDIVLGNVIDGRGNWANNKANMLSGITLLFNQAETATDLSSANVSNNVIKGIGGLGNRVSINLENTVGAVVTGNQIYAGECSTLESAGCVEDEDCPGSETCVTSQGYGILLNAGAGSAVSKAPQGNIIANNIIGTEALEWPGHTTWGPIAIESQAGSSGDPEENTNNLIANNLCYIPDASNQRCVTGTGLAALAASNLIYGNVNMGEATNADTHNLNVYNGIRLTNGTNTYCLDLDGTAIYQDDNCDGSKGAGENYID